MANKLTEQDLQDLFHKNLPPVTLPPAFADELRQRVLLEVSTTLKPAAPEMSVPMVRPGSAQATTPAGRATARAHATHRRAQRPSEVGLLDGIAVWFANLRLASSITFAVATVAVLIMAIVMLPRLLGGLDAPGAGPQTGAQPTTLPLVQPAPRNTTSTSTTPVPLADAPTADLTFDGSVTIIRADGSREEVDAGDASPIALSRGDRVIADERASLDYFAGQSTTLEAGSDVELVDLGADNGGTQVVLIVHNGRTRHRIDGQLQAQDRFEVRTTAATASVLGTEFLVEVAQNGETYVETASGIVLVVTADGQQANVAANQFINVAAGQSLIVQTLDDNATAPVATAPDRTEEDVPEPAAPEPVTAVALAPTATPANGAPATARPSAQLTPAPVATQNGASSAAPTPTKPVTTGIITSPTAVTTTVRQTATATAASVRQTTVATNTPSAAVPATATPRPSATPSTATVVGTATATPTPTVVQATAAPTIVTSFAPTATATRTVRPTATQPVLNPILATATNTPRPTATSTLRPIATNTPRPTATNTPRPTATNTPLPTATNTPLPTATNTPTNTPLPTPTATPANRAPVAKSSVTVATNEEQPFTIPLLTYYDDPDGDSTSLLAVSEATFGTVTRNDNGTVTYLPQTDFVGDDSFTFQISDGRLSTTGTAVITVRPINDAPRFDLSSNRVDVTEDPGLQTVSGWAVNIAAGPANESDQGLQFQVTTDNPSLFSNPPAIAAATGTLTFTPAANANGAATVTVTLVDSAGGSSAPGTFVIAIAADNDAPSFDLNGNQVNVLEDAGAQTMANWAVGIKPGPANEADQTTSFQLTVDNPALFSSQPTLNGTNGDLTFAPAPHANGATTVRVVLVDSLGATSGERSFTITIAAVNDAPTFDMGSSLAVNEDAGQQTITGWATNIAPGPANEADQSVSFQVTVDNPALFSNAPQLDATTGTLTFTPAPEASGAATVNVILQDNAGGATSVRTFVITVIPVDDAPIAQNDLIPGSTQGPITGNVLGNNGSGVDSDPEGSTLTVVTVNGSPINPATGRMLSDGNNEPEDENAGPVGQLIMQANGDFTYTSLRQDGTNMPVSFTYTIVDANGNRSNAATVTIAVP